MPKKDRTLLIGLIFNLLFLSTWFDAKASAARQTPPLPTEGWRVCEDLGVGTVPGLGEERQRFLVCNNPAGWEVQAYCLDPGQTPPSVGAYCSLVGENTLWCGDAVQQIEIYAILQIPPTPSATPTATQTSTATMTPTATPSPTSTMTSTATPIPSASAVPPSATPLPSQTAPAATQAPAPRPTATQRIAPGGPGNLGRIGLGALLTGTMLIGMVLLVRKGSRRR